MATILIVDDRPTNRELLVSLLGYRGHRLIESDNGVEGLALARAERPDLVIADIVMPSMDGYQFVRELRADPRIAATRVVFYTATYLEAEARTLAERCGVTHIITKPCDPEIVLRIVDEVLSQPADPAPIPDMDERFDREHLRLVTDKLKGTADEVTALNERLSQLVSLTQQLASERHPRRLLENLCHSAREIVGAHLAAIGVRGDNGHRLADLIVSGAGAEETARLSPPLPGVGILASLLAGRPVLRLAGDLGDPPSLGLPQGWPPATSLLAVPIVSPTKIYGWLCLTGKVNGDAFSADDERLALTLAAHAGRTYENGSLYKELEGRALDLQREVEERRRAEETVRLHARRLEALHQLDQAVLAADSAPALASAVVHHLRQVIACDRVYVVLTDADTHIDVVLATESGRPAARAGAALAGGSAPGRAALLAALSGGEARVFGALDAADLPAPLAEWARHGMRSAMAVGLRVRERLIGMLVVGSRDPQAFAEEQTTLAQEMAAPLAIGIEHLRLGERIRQHSAELERRVTERTMQLQAAIDDLESFSYSVSHDLKAPLRHLRGFAKILVDDHAGQLDAEGLRCLERVQAAGQRMEELIADLLSLAHVSVGELTEEAVDLSVLAAGIVNQLRQIGPEREVEAIIAPHVTVQGDRRLLRLVLENLLGNAWKYTGRHPRARIEFGVTEEDGQPVYYVRDDGAGFDPAHAEQLFAPFQRLHSTAEFEGTGIGLAIVQRVIRRHGGRIWAESSVEGGATFSFTLGRLGM